MTTSLAEPLTTTNIQVQAQPVEKKEHTLRVLLLKQNLDIGLSVFGTGLGIVGTILHNLGYEVKIVDNNTQYKQYNNKDLLKIIEEYKPDTIGFSVAVHNALETYMLIQEINKKYPKIITVAGGIHMCVASEEALRNGFDIAVPREAETIVPLLYDHIESHTKDNFHEDLEEIQGVSFVKKDGTFHHAKEFPVLDNLDDVPVINYELFNLKDYFKHGKEPGNIYILGQRGCPFKCNFCSDEVQFSDKRVSSAQWLFDCVKEYHEKYGQDYFSMTDNNFTLPRKRAVDFANLIINSELHGKITFSCQTKVETPMDEELLLLLKKAGLKRVYMGLERMEEYSLKMINKKSKKEKVYKVLDTLKKVDIEVAILILIGFPFETPELLEKEYENFNGLREYTKLLSCAILQPIPGTIYYDQYPKSQGWYLDKDALARRRSYFSDIFNAHFMDQVALNHFDLPEETQKAVEETFLKFKFTAHGNYVKKVDLFYKLMCKLDVSVAKISEIFFKISPPLEHAIFKRVKSLRYYWGTYLFGDRVG